MELIAPDLLEQYGTLADVVLPSQRLKKEKVAGKPIHELSRKARKRKEQIIQKLELKKRRADAAASLASHTLTPNEAELLNLKQQLKRTKKGHRWISIYQAFLQKGLPVPAELEEYIKRGEILAARHAEKENGKAISEIGEMGCVLYQSTESSTEESYMYGKSQIEEMPNNEKKPKLQQEASSSLSKIAIELARKLEPEFCKRPSEIESQRAKLPAYLQEQEIMETILLNSVTLITGGTGCGKSTQIPQFVFEAGYAMGKCKVGITQPRRVATIAVHDRVREELGELHHDFVSYQIRYEQRNVSEKAKLRFMTDGILVQELKSDKLLKKYSMLILDEIHERSINCDILLGTLPHIVRGRQILYESQMKAGFKNPLIPLKVILMSATIEKDLLWRLFDSETSLGHVDIGSKLFPVTLHFAKVTPDTRIDSLECVKKKILQIHRRLPSGSILVFLNGRSEIHYLLEALKGKKKRKIKFNDDDEEKSELASSSETESLSSDESDDGSQVSESEDDLLGKSSFTLPGEEEDETPEPELPSEQSIYLWEGSAEGHGQLRVIPLYAALSPEKQKEAFSVPSETERIVILATNVAETSITLPNVRYVIDSGQEKRRVFSNRSATRSKFGSFWISKMSAEQRAGRAGRLGPGHCYRLYSSAVFKIDFIDTPPVKLLMSPLDEVMQYISSLNLDFRKLALPSLPSGESICAAHTRLFSAGILDANFSLTKFGLETSKLPIAPRYASIVIRGISIWRNWSSASGKTKLSPDFVKYICIAAAALSIGSAILGYKENPKAKRKALNNSIDDLEYYINALLAFSKAEDRQKFCNENYLVYSQLCEVAALALELYDKVGSSIEDENCLKVRSKLGRVRECAKLSYPSPIDFLTLNRVVTMALCDQIALHSASIYNVGFDQSDEDMLKKTSEFKKQYECVESGVHSCIAMIDVNSIVSYKGPNKAFAIAYNELVETENSVNETKKLAMRGAILIRDLGWIRKFVEERKLEACKELLDKIPHLAITSSSHV